MRRILGSAVLVLATLLPSHALAANTWGTDLSDLWWNAEESGWGANIAHQGEVMFVTLFVYGMDNKVKWYVGPATTSQGGASASTFSGELYEATGPYIGRLFNPSDVVLRPVGTVTIDFPTGTSASLSYNVDGVYNTKWMERQTFRSNEPSGSYIGARIGSAAGCTTGSGSFASAAQFVVGHTGSGSGIVISSSKGDIADCMYSGAYTQHGRMGSISGSASCPDGRAGTFQAFEMEAGQMGFTSRYTADYGGGCTESGVIGGVKR